MRSFLVDPSGNIAIILGMAALFVTAIAYVAWLQPTPATAGTPIDISGVWNTTLAGDTTGSCLDDITQTGILVSGTPSSGEVWQVQIGHIDNDDGASRLEPAASAGFAAGKPWASFIFDGVPAAPTVTAVESYELYR